MQSLPGTTRFGAILSLLGVGLFLLSTLIISRIHPASLGSQDLWLVLFLALIILGIGACAFFRTLPRGLLVLQCWVGLLSILLQLFVYLVNALLDCLDMCSPANASIGEWILFGLFGLLLSGVGALGTLYGSYPWKV